MLVGGVSPFAGFGGQFGGQFGGGGQLFNTLGGGSPFIANGGAGGQFPGFNVFGAGAGGAGGDLPGLGPLGSGLFNLGGAGLNRLAANSADFPFWLAAAGQPPVPIIFQPYYVPTIPGLGFFMTG